MKNFIQGDVFRAARVGVLALLCVAGLSACASTKYADETDYGAPEVYDPLESMNRGVFAFNNVVDDVALEPAARGYRAVVPRPVRSGVRNFLTNLRSPITFANQVLQGDARGAGNAFARAAINTTVGVGGLFDVAAKGGLKDEPEDFGQTLAVWGVGHGPYLVLPIMGPSSVRDGTGLVVDSFIDPVRLYLFNTDREGWHYARIGVTALDTREALLDVMEDLERNSFDYYAATRSSYIQRRAALVNDGDPAYSTAPAIPVYDDY